MSQIKPEFELQSFRNEVDAIFRCYSKIIAFHKSKYNYQKIVRNFLFLSFLFLFSPALLWVFIMHFLVSLKHQKLFEYNYHFVILIILIIISFLGIYFAMYIYFPNIYLTFIAYHLSLIVVNLLSLTLFSYYINFYAQKKIGNILSKISLRRNNEFTYFFSNLNKYKLILFPHTNLLLDKSFLSSSCLFNSVFYSYYLSKFGYEQHLFLTSDFNTYRHPLFVKFERNDTKHIFFNFDITDFNNEEKLNLTHSIENIFNKYSLRTEYNFSLFDNELQLILNTFRRQNNLNNVLKLKAKPNDNEKSRKKL